MRGNVPSAACSHTSPASAGAAGSRTPPRGPAHSRLAKTTNKATGLRRQNPLRGPFFLCLWLIVRSTRWPLIVTSPRKQKQNRPFPRKRRFFRSSWANLNRRLYGLSIGNSSYGTNDYPLVFSDAQDGWQIMALDRHRLRSSRRMPISSAV